ncbi:MAG TPA: hypothetical protein VJT71_09890 [Pyrinomonadaceae bacterium]|nr:hypothetical protein [Pyrinomonadaceae bacterium]
MSALKCSHCGFTGFADNGYCKSCGQALSSPEFRNSSRRSGSQAGKPLKALACIVILGGVITGVVVGASKLKKYWDPNAAYIEAIAKSAQFKEPVTIRLNQSELHSSLDFGRNYFQGRTAGKAVKAADVLEGLGLVHISTETSVETRTFGEGIFSNPTRSQLTNQRLLISLTEKGSKEAEGWRDTEEPYQDNPLLPKLSSRVTWWRIPIGDRVITRIESATESEGNTMNIVFKWRWQPNQLGENFNYGSAAVDSLPEKAHDAAAAMGLSSKTEYSATAKLKPLGGLWEVVQINFMNQPIVKE